MSPTMRGVMLRGPRDAAVVEVPVPEPGPGEVVLHVRAALTCGTDAKVFRRGYHARMLTPPCLIGHEYAGVISAVGKDVTGFSEGDRVVGANSSPCGDCEYCAAGREALCDDLVFINGAFAESMLLPERLVRTNLHHVPRGLDASSAAAADPVACVIKGAEISDPRPGESVLVIGSGPIGQMFCAELASLGVPPTIFTRREQGAQLGARMGAAQAVVTPALEVAQEQLLAASRDGRGYDLVIEAAGAQETSQHSLDVCRKGGRILLFGGCGHDDRVSWSPARLHYDEITVLSSFHHTPRHIDQALEAMADGRITVKPLLEPAVGLEGVSRALEDMCARTLRGKVPVVPSEGCC